MTYIWELREEVQVEVMAKAQVMVVGENKLKLEKQQKGNHPNQGGSKNQQWGRRRAQMRQFRR